ncbi:MAG TPA: hypothetical protein VFG72_02015 [Marmoricola sp.]|nr:hypothetical protein [Marmoricola sp.]
MSESSAEANEADRLEQQTPLDAEEVGEMGPELSPIEEGQAAEGDVLEQRLEVPGEDDYVTEEE